VNPLDELSKLTALFPGEESLIASCRYIPKTETPEPYKRMLVHDKHMTVTMESYHGCPVTVQVLRDRLDDDVYCREIILHRSDDSRPVQFGIVRFAFQYVTPEVREEITQKETPLGRILINHNVMRHVDLGAILEITAGPGLAKYLDMPEGAVTYGRLATIFCNGQPAVDLLEVSSPLES
jgi:chorismate-pyruvate lyase